VWIVIADGQYAYVVMALSMSSPPTITSHVAAARAGCCKKRPGANKAMTSMPATAVTRDQRRMPLSPAPLSTPALVVTMTPAAILGKGFSKEEWKIYAPRGPIVRYHGRAAGRRALVSSAGEGSWMRARRKLPAAAPLSGPP